MSVEYPHIKVRLSGEDGNVFSLAARVTKAMRLAGVAKAEVDSFWRELMDSPSYDDALMRTVNVS